jgi:hypothetical protein
MKNYSAKAIGLGFGFIGAAVIGTLEVAGILHSTSSTAAIGFIFLPIPCLLAFCAFFIFGYSVGYIRDQRANETKKIRFQLLLIILLVICFIGYIGKEIFIGLGTMNYVSEIEVTDNHEKLTSVFESPIFGKNKFVLGALAQNKYATAELLDKIAHLPDHELFNAMGSLFPVLGKNGKGLAVMRLVVLNPNVFPSTVEYLATNTDEKYVLGDIAGNSKTSETTLRKLEHENNYLIDWGLARNQKTPHDIFARLLDRKKDSSFRWTLESISINPGASLEIKKKAAQLLKESN